jgi:hypothetical protein
VSDLDAVRRNLASLNEIIAEMTAKVSDDPAFTAMTRDILRDHSWELGYEFQGERPPARRLRPVPRPGGLPARGAACPASPARTRGDDCAPR